nr:MAG TPA: transcription factor [Caudoviricetes sp.]
MEKEQQKDKIIEIVKKAIDDNSVTAYGEDDIVSIDGDDVDHIAEEVAEEVYDLYTSVLDNFDNGIESLKRGIKELQDENAGLNRECNDYLAKIDQLQAKLAQVLMGVDKTKEWTLDRAKTEGAKEFAEKVKNLLLVTYSDYWSPLGDITGKDIVCDIDELLEEYTE